MSQQEETAKVYINDVELVDAELIGDWKAANLSQNDKRSCEECEYIKAKFAIVREELERISVDTQKLRNKL